VRRLTTARANALTRCGGTPQVLITPHSAFLTHEAPAHIAATTISNIEEFLSGQALTNELMPQPDKE
jgi:phosphoglycerate dehydrogenase-like enzyme